MSPADHVTAIELRRLQRDTEADLVALDKLRDDVARIAGRPLGLDDEAQAFLAVRLHAWYTALESMLERIARTIEGSLTPGPSTHRDLLRGMTLRLADVRPAVLDPSRLPDLADLLAFRHFFRHVYAVDLDEDQLRDHAARLLRVHAPTAADLRAFLVTVEAWVEQVEGR